VNNDPLPATVAIDLVDQAGNQSNTLCFSLP
jgi:hypothetical protein